MTTFYLNDVLFSTEAPAGRSLLEVIRNEARLTGTKRVCGEGDCGACTVIIARQAQDEISFSTAASCILPVAEAHGALVITVEGISRQDNNPIQEIMIQTGASQCGFCSPGIVLALTAFLLCSPSLSDDDAIMWIEGNLCRCTGYAGIHRAALAVAAHFRPILTEIDDRMQLLIHHEVLAPWISDTVQKIHQIDTHAIQNTQTTAVAGATDLFVQQQHSLETAALNFLSSSDLRDDIWKSDDAIYIGARCPVDSLRTDESFLELFPKASLAIRLISSQLIRQRATVAGNLVNASPIGDLSILFLAMSATVGIQKGSKNRHVPLSSFFQSYKQIDLQKDELIEWISVPLENRSRLIHFEKVSRRIHLDIASVNSAISLSVQDSRITDALVSAGGVSPVPLLLSETGKMLEGSEISVATVKKAMTSAALEISPITDVRGDKEYKATLLKRLILAHFVTLFPDHDFREALS